MNPSGTLFFKRDVAVNYKRWRQQFELYSYMEASGVKGRTDGSPEREVAILQRTTGPKA